jgi:hypothetical protein
MLLIQQRRTLTSVKVNTPGFLGGGTSRRTHDVSSNTVRIPGYERRRWSMLRRHFASGQVIKGSCSGTPTVRVVSPAWVRTKT